MKIVTHVSGRKNMIQKFTKKQIRGDRSEINFKSHFNISFISL